MVFWESDTKDTAPPPRRAQAPTSPERDILERLAFESLREQRRSRRWGIFFKSLFALYLIALLFVFKSDGVSPPTGAHTALVDVDGIIAVQGDANADRVVGGLRAAFEARGAKGVILRINSPGGSPVQSSYINQEILRLRSRHPEKPVYAVVTDICASGGYYVAAAADKIYANESSIVGSIGVLMNGFGFVETLEKLGVERRLMTAGKFKGMLDPFSPLDPQMQQHAQMLLDGVHEEFINAVKSGRGDRLAQDEKIFSGLIWTGREAKELGLIDDFGSPGYVAREIIGEKKIVDYTPQEDLFQKFADRIGVAIAKTIRLEALVDRLEMR